MADLQSQDASMPGLTASELGWYRQGYADALDWALQNLDLPDDAIDEIEAVLDV